MHELVLAQSIVETVLDEMKKRGLSHVNVVGIRVGALSGVEPEALEFCFDALSKDTPLAGACLAIENVPITVTCRACGKHLQIEKYLFICPYCNCSDVELDSITELVIAFLQIEDDPPAVHKQEQEAITLEQT
ncbi:MAG: hydrogenase maturation nickel metallochaperone HypA [Candidatus Zixiibacteriota bacterium]